MGGKVHAGGLALCCVAGLAIAGSARAQSDDAIRRYILQQFPSCQLTGMQVVFRGALPGETRPVAVATYGVEGCPCGNCWQADFGAFVEDAGRVRELPHPKRRRASWPDVVERVTVAAGRIQVQAKAYGPADAHCCPSLVRRESFAARDGSLVPVR